MNKISVPDAGCRMPRREFSATRKQLLATSSCGGFTLIEMIMVIVITGIIGSMVAVFIKAPVQQYMDISRRAELSDIADTAFYQLAGELSTAVPNSLRIAGCGGTPCFEFIPAKEAGRYRAAADLSNPASGVGDVLDFGSVSDRSFDIIGPGLSFATGDYIVIGSTQSDGGPAYDVSASGVLRTYAGTAGTSKSNVVFAAAQFPSFAQLDTQRFDVLDGVLQAVTYSCEGTLGTLDASGNGQARLWKHWAYGFNAAQIAPASLGGSKAVLADKVSACVIDYTAINQRLGLLGIRLTLTSGNENVSLYQEIHVSNAP
jgi:MSHA biogenesis protein MshO